MLHQIVAGLTASLDTHLRQTLGSQDPCVVSAPLVHADGSLSSLSAGRLSLSVTGISLAPGSGKAAATAHVDVVLAANHASPDYLAGLEQLAHAANHLAAQPTLQIDDLSLSVAPKEMEDEELEELWNRLGTPYRPSLNYTIVATRRRPAKARSTKRRR